MESSPEFLGPQALAKAMRFVGDPRDGAKIDRLEKLNGEHGIWECTRCYFCNERCPKGVDPRDAIAKLGAESIKEGIDRDMGAKHAKWFVVSAKTTGWLRETELVPKTQGIVESIKQTRFALGLARVGKVPPPVPAPRREGREGVAAAARPAPRAGPATATPGSCRASGRSRKLAHGHDEGDATTVRRRARSRGRTCRARRAEPAPGSRMKKVAYYKGCLASLSAKELDSSTQALAPKVGLELRSSSRSPAAAPATSTRPSPTTTST